MKKTGLLVAAAVLLFPLLAAAQASGRSGNPRVGSVSADDEAPAEKPRARKKGLVSPVPLPGGDSQPAKKAPAADEGAPALVITAPGEDLNEAGGDRFEKLAIKSRLGSALASLSSIRSSLMIYYGDTEGTFPPDLQTLVPAQADDIPQLNIPGYSKTNKVTVVKSLKGENVSKAVRNTGGWLYIADKTNPKLWGEVRIDSAKIYKGKPLYEY